MSTQVAQHVYRQVHSKMLFFVSCQITQLQVLYGQPKLSHKKIQCFTQWKAGASFNLISERVHVAEATVQVYVIDVIAAGKLAGPEDFKELLLAMNVEMGDFDAVVQEVSDHNKKLRDIREETALSYNQIRAVLAVLINGYEGH